MLFSYPAELWLLCVLNRPCADQMTDDCNNSTHIELFSPLACFPVYPTIFLPTDLHVSGALDARYATYYAFHYYLLRRGTSDM